MLDWLYEWIKNLSFYMILVSVVLKVLPGGNYDKYIQFVSGLILILVMAMPIIRITGAEDHLSEIYQNNEYEQKKQEMEMMEKYFQEADLLDFLPEEYMQVDENTEESKIVIEPISVEE